MFSKDDIEKYLNSVPPVPQILLASSQALDAGDMIKAANIASEDPALINYVKNIVNKPIFGFRDEVKDPKQIFGILGLGRARQMLYSYYVSLLTPKKWIVFNLTNYAFSEIQADFLVGWQKILDFIGENDDELLKAVTLIPSSIAVCEAIFEGNLENIRLIQKQKALSYDIILFKTTGLHFFDIVAMVAKKWGFSDRILEFYKSMYRKKSPNLETYMKLLIAYILSKPQYENSGLGDFFEMDIDCSQEHMSNFFAAIQGNE